MRNPKMSTWTLVASYHLGIASKKIATNHGGGSKDYSIKIAGDKALKAMRTTGSVYGMLCRVNYRLGQDRAAMMVAEQAQHTREAFFQHAKKWGIHEATNMLFNTGHKPEDIYAAQIAFTDRNTAQGRAWWSGPGDNDGDTLPLMDAPKGGK